MENYQAFEIKEFDYWVWYLHENQSYLGRTYLLAKRNDALDFIEMTEAEQREFFMIAKIIKRTLAICFNPDLINYAALGNRFRHLHVHFIPRYENARIFFNIQFIDHRWGMNYAPEGRNPNVTQHCLHEIKRVMQEGFWRSMIL